MKVRARVFLVLLAALRRSRSKMFSGARQDKQPPLSYCVGLYAALVEPNGDANLAGDADERTLFSRVQRRKKC